VAATPSSQDARLSPGAVLATGSAWTGLGQVITALAGLIGSVLAARLIEPADFGLIGIAMLVIRLLQAVTQTGFERALVQREDVDGMLHVGWTFQVLRGAALMAIMLVSAPALARFYAEPGLTGILIVMGVSLLMQSSKNMTGVLFQRKLHFRALFAVTASSAVANAVIAVVAIVALRNAWALVVAHVAASVTEVVVSYIAHAHRPRFDFDLKKAAELLKYGKWVTGMNLLGLLVTRGDDIFVSKYLGAAALGYYVIAYELANLPATQITHVLGRVSFPTYARLQSDPAQLRRAFLDVMKATLLVTAPLSVLLLFLVPGIVAFIIGDKWAPIIPLVRLLAITGFIRSVVALGGALFHGTGVPRLDVWMNLPRLAIMLLLLWPAAARYGLVGVSIVVLLSVTSCVPTWIYGVRATTGVRLNEILHENSLAWVASGALALSFGASTQSIDATSGFWFVLQIALGFAGWVALMWLVGRTTRLSLLTEVRRLLRALRPSKV
jgi:O-antigen/teichoic acid export membrane protein